jgi:hypothetical protein
VNRGRPEPERERHLLRLRHLLGIELLDAAAADPAFVAPQGFDGSPGMPPEMAADMLTPGAVRAAILSSGCLLARELVPRPQAEHLAALIERAYKARERTEAGDPDRSGYYEPFEPEQRFGGVLWRPWIKEGGGLLAADSPRLCFELTEALLQAGVPQLVSSYLGEPALISVHKTTLRRAEPSVAGAWHQDGAFMGPVRSLNLWLSLSRCGDLAPGLDILPQRVDRYLDTGTQGAELSWTISGSEVASAATQTAVVRPIFEPGDGLLFDERLVHKTGSDPAMPNPRFAVECWFFGGSAFPSDYAPLAV